MQLSSQIKHQSSQSDRLSIFWAIPSQPLTNALHNFANARVGLSTTTPQATAFAHAFSGVSVSIPIAEWKLK